MALGLRARNKKPSLRSRVMGRTMAGRVARAAGAVGVGVGGVALARKAGLTPKLKPKSIPGSAIVPASAATLATRQKVNASTPLSAKRLANRQKVERRRAALGKVATAKTRGRTAEERRNISSMVKKRSKKLRTELGSNYTHYQRKILTFVRR